MIVRETVPHGSGPYDLDDEAGLTAIEDFYRPPRRPWVRLNMVTTLVGSAVGADGTSDSITSPVDRAILKVIRGFADVVVVGARTVRAEQYVLPRGGATLAIVTRSGDLSGARVVEQAREKDARDRILLITPRESVAAVAERNPDLAAQVVGVDTDDGHPSPATIVAALAARGLASVVCEGGTSLASSFAQSGVLDELCVTVAPSVGPVQGPFLEVDDRLDTEVAGALGDEAGFSYLRLRVRR